MTKTYKNDDSFFTCLYAPGSLHRWTVRSWFEDVKYPMFRFIRDLDVEQQYLNLQQVHEIYPGISTITVVVNPWRRVSHAYNTMVNQKLAEDRSRNIPANTFEFNIDNFESFVFNIPKAPADSKFWFTPTTPQVRWCEYEIDGAKETVTHILRDEHMIEDFKPIQDYFVSNTPLTLQEELPEYQEFYNSSTKQRVAEIFAEDIERFGYTF